MIERKTNNITDKFSKIYSRFQKPIFSYVSQRISNEARAEEITQEIFFKAFRARNDYDEKYAISTWLWTIARNTVFDVLRKYKADNPANVLDGDSGFCPDTLASNAQSAEAILHKRDVRRSLFKVMKSLTRLQRRVIWMSVVQQRSYAEIAKHLGLSSSAVKNLAYRARIAMEQKFTGTSILGLV